MGNRKWTAEEESYLCEHWGTTSIPTLAKKLNRSKDAGAHEKSRRRESGRAYREKTE